jgi:hypothetical protein
VRRTVLRAGTVVLFVVIQFATAAAQSGPSAEPADNAAVMRRLESLERRVQELEGRNQLLERRLAEAGGSTAGQPTPAATQVATAQPADAAQKAQPSPAVAQQQSDSMPGMQVPPSVRVPEGYPSLKIRGFADADFSSTDTKSQTQGFNLGQFVLHASSALAPKTSFFGELSWTARTTGYTLEVERAIIRYDVNDHFKASFGKYHTPINYWNTAFHHGAWLQTTISRPEMIQFGGRFLPVHFVGALVEGAIPSGGLGLNYNFGVGNGRQTIGLLGRDGDAGDVNSNRAWIAAIFARPVTLYGLQFGGSVYRDLVSPDVINATSYRELISSGYVVWTKETPEFLTEFANVRHTDIRTGREWNSQGMYTQIAYRLPAAFHKFKPYYRFEYIHVPATEPVLQIQNLLGGHTLGARYDVTDFAAFKAEFRRFKRSDTVQSNGLFLQTAFTF